MEDIVCCRFLLLVDAVSMSEKKDDSSVLEDFLLRWKRPAKDRHNGRTSVPGSGWGTPSGGLGWVNN
jgi:hypothetical protein